MIDFKIKIGGFVFALHTLFEDTKAMSKDYLTDEKEDLGITVTSIDIETERDFAKKEAELEGIPYQNFTDGNLETTAIYRKIADFLSFNNATVFHGALISKGNEGYLFTAKSGTGKTTHIRNWLKSFDDCYVVNGDKPILRIFDDKVEGYGTPWAGKEGYQNNTSVKIKAIIYLTRGETNSIKEIDFFEIMPILVSQSYRSKDDFGVARALDNASKMADKVKFYKLACNMDVESAIVAFEGMNK